MIKKTHKDDEHTFRRCKILSHFLTSKWPRTELSHCEWP
jgi:hypothetical protein